MTDLAALAFLVAFFALAIGLVKACERIIGPDVEAARTDTETETDRQVAA